MNDPRGLREIEQFQLSRGMLRDTQLALQQAGIDGHECFVLWTGRRQSQRTAVLRRVYVPAQTAGTHEQGLSVTVTGEELQALNAEWHARQEELMVQVHSHPASPYMSATDVRYPIVAVEGGISIVVPLFGFCALTDLRSCAVFRLWSGEWRWVHPRDVDQLLRLV